MQKKNHIRGRKMTLKRLLGVRMALEKRKLSRNQAGGGAFEAEGK